MGWRWGKHARAPSTESSFPGDAPHPAPFHSRAGDSSLAHLSSCKRLFYAEPFGSLGTLTMDTLNRVHQPGELMQQRWLH